MTDVMLFHHAQGLTDGVIGFGDQLTAAGHRVTMPDLYHGATFATIGDGVAHAERIGFETIIADGFAAAEELPATTVYGGFSLGALVAHKLAQTRPGALGALLYHHGDVPITTFGTGWPSGVDVQLHINEHDEWAELDIVREFVAQANAGAHAELFLYPGSTHLFTDSSLPDHRPESAALAIQRTLDFLESHG